MKNTQRDIMCAHLESAGLKKTESRINVLEILLVSREPLTVEDIQKKLKKNVHFVTLYRMLRQFVEKGIVYQTDFRTGKAYFELQQEHHHHVVCVNCGKREDVKACVTELQKNVQKEVGNFANIYSHSLEFFGTCNACVK